jgi:glutaredoxin
MLRKQSTLRHEDVRVYNRQMNDVVVYSRKGCHLCDIVKETLTQIQDEADFQWREVDIDADPQLRQEYTDQVPVVFIDGRKAFKYRMDRRQFLRVLAGRNNSVLLRRMSD